VIRVRRPEGRAARESPCPLHEPHARPARRRRLLLL